MRKTLSIDKRVALYGNKQNIEQAENIILLELPEILTLSESLVRIKLQEVIDNKNIKANILFNGNTVWSKKKIIRDIKKIKKHGMEKLTDYLYEFLSLSCGSIAHYDIYGWIACYPTIQDLRQFFRSNEFGERVLNYLPVWHSDAQVIVKEVEQELDNIPGN